MRDERFTEDPFICYCLVLEWNNFQTAAGYMHPLGIFAWQILIPSLRAIFRLTFQIYESHAFQEISVFRAFPPHPLLNDVSACTLKKTEFVHAICCAFFESTVCVKNMAPVHAVLSQYFCESTPTNVDKIYDVAWNNYRLMKFVISNSEWYFAHARMLTN